VWVGGGRRQVDEPFSLPGLYVLTLGEAIGLWSIQRAENHQKRAEFCHGWRLECYG
jgi:hypothetical protein